MDILITGINGFVAQSVVGAFKEQGHRIYGIGIQESAACELNGYYSIDITKPFKLKREFDIVLHLAAFNRTHINADFEYELFYKVNVLGTRNVAECCKYKKFIFMSTTSLYRRDVDYITEESEICLGHHYAKSKYEAEILCREIIDPCKLVILRSVNIVGIRQEAKAIIPIFFQRALMNEEIRIFVPSNRTIQLLDVEDLSTLYLAIFASDINGIYNLATDYNIGLYDLALEIIKICNSHSIISVGCEGMESKAKVIGDKLLGVVDWRPKKDMMDILNEYYHRIINNTI